MPTPPTPKARAFADRIAARYGVADFPKVESIRFTCNVRQGGEDIAREWTWYPRLDSVLFEGKDPKGLYLQAAYSRRNKFSLSSMTVAGIEKSFLHDQFWLLFPLYLAWDRDLSVKLGEEGMLSVRDPKEGGNVYDLKADRDGAIRFWMIHRGGSATAERTDWSRPQEIDGLPISLDRSGPMGFKIWFTQVRITGIQ